MSILDTYIGKSLVTNYKYLIKKLIKVLKPHYVIFEILLSGSPYSWETVLSTTVVHKPASLQ